MLVYTFHKYWTAPDREVIRDYLDFGERFKVPLYMGESGENDNEWIGKFRRTLEENGVGWCFWPYKKVGATSCVANIRPPAHYEELIRFADAPRQTFEEIRKAREAAPRAKEALLDLPRASRVAGAEINRAYLEALGFSKQIGGAQMSAQPR